MANKVISSLMLHCYEKIESAKIDELYEYREIPEDVDPNTAEHQALMAFNLDNLVSDDKALEMTPEEYEIVNTVEDISLEIRKEAEKRGKRLGQGASQPLTILGYDLSKSGSFVRMLYLGGVLGALAVVFYVLT